MNKPGKINLLEKSEQTQALARFIIVGIVALYIGGLVMFTAQPPEIVRTAIAALAYWPVAGVWWYYVKKNPLPFDEAVWRIYSGIFGDTTMTGILIAIGGVNMIAIYVIYLWVILGNAMRFGSNIMPAATAASVISLSVAATMSPVWILPPVATIVFILGLIFVDMFTRQLLRERDAAHLLVNRLSKELHEARFGSQTTRLLDKNDFLINVDEQISVLPDGGLLAAVIISYKGESAAMIGNPHSQHGSKLIKIVSNELRGSDIATIGRENELWLLIEPKRLNDAYAVAERIHHSLQDADPAISTKTGIAAYPMVQSDARGLIEAARLNINKDKIRSRPQLYSVDRNKE